MLLLLALDAWQTEQFCTIIRDVAEKLILCVHAAVVADL